MSLRLQIDKDFIAAMKSGDKRKKETLGMLKSAITTADKTSGTNIDDTKILDVINAGVKQRQQTIDILKKDFEPGSPYENTAISMKIGEAVEEQEWLKAYLPKQLAETEIRQLVKMVIEKNTLTKENRGAIGVVMKYFKENHNGEYDAQILKMIFEQEIA